MAYSFWETQILRCSKSRLRIFIPVFSFCLNWFLLCPPQGGTWRTMKCRLYINCNGTGYWVCVCVEDDGGGWEVATPPPPHLPLAGSVTINAKTTWSTTAGFRKNSQNFTSCFQNNFLITGGFRNNFFIVLDYLKTWRFQEVFSELASVFIQILLCLTLATMDCTMGLSGPFLVWFCRSRPKSMIVFEVLRCAS
jgi:hypothetical protein